MAKQFPFSELFFEYIIKYSASSLLPPFYRTGFYHQSNVQLKKTLLLHVLYIFCLFFVGTVWETLIATHFSVRLFGLSSVVLLIFCFCNMSDQKFLTISK